MNILVKNIKTGKHYKIKVGFKAKIGDRIQRISDIKYIYNGEFEDCVVVKIFDKPKKKKPIYAETAELVKSIKDNYQKNMGKLQLQELRSRPYFKTIITRVKGKSSRGENLERIKFPCWCIYKIRGIENIGQLNKVHQCYNLYYVGEQGEENFIDGAYTLKGLMDNYDIEILKGELHLWREVE